ncbi:MAG TPA: flagellar M-ring protein FliF C-terminal domain-containing protein, partial [Vulgatibacter sp.]|nr:flagellar M-ring protein FliF C-terminal domain-containing protein [Vulgatibacter sp.]
KTVTTSVQRSPRILRLSVAVVIDGLSGQPRSDAELARLGNLVRRAVGFDASRGDQIEVSSFPFNDGSTPPDAEAPPLPFEKPVIIGVAAVLAALAFLAGLLLLTRRRRRTRQLPAAADTPARELPEELVGSDVLPESPLTTQSLPDPNLAIRDRARELASQDPVQAARLLRAWLAADEAETEMATNE